MAKRLYLDHAATSWPKPDAVRAAVLDHFERLGAPAGRGSYREADEVERLIADCRRQIAELIGAQDARHVIFTLNGTDSLNQVLHGLLRPGDHVVTSVVEHNSMLRPLKLLEGQGVEVTRVDCDAEGRLNPDQVVGALRPNTRLVALIHASNVTGTLQPLAEIGERIREHPARFLVDAAQSLGYLPLQVNELQADYVAAPGHKGLLGPLGTGILYIAEGAEIGLHSTRQGGTGTHSDDDQQPEALPEKYESGNLNVPGILGLRAGVAAVRTDELPQIRRAQLERIRQFVTGLDTLPNVQLYGPRVPEQRVAVFSVNVTGFDPRELAALLDSAFGIQVRAGFQCAPRIHQRLGTDGRGGTLRISMGHNTSEADVERVLSALAAVS